MKIKIKPFSYFGKSFLFSATIWLITILSFLGSFAIVHSVVGVVDFSRLPDGKMNDFFFLAFALNILVGIVAFCMAFVALVKLFFNEKTDLHFRIFSPINICVLIFISIILLSQLLSGTAMIYAGDSKPPRVDSNIVVSPSPTPFDKVSDENIVLRINEEREKEHLASFIINDNLESAAYLKVQDIINKNYWAENSPDGKTPWVHLNKVGYRYSIASILLGKGYTTSLEYIQAWMNNPSNKKDLLNKNYKEIGVFVGKARIDGIEQEIVVVYLGNPVNSVPVANSDPIISCKVHADCGGGTKQLKKSICEQSTCCQIGNNWKFYESNTKCEEDQKNSNTTNNTQNSTQQSGNKVPVFLTYLGYTTYCPSQNVNAVQSIDSTMNSKKTQWAQDYNKCSDNFFKNDSCFNSCKDTNTSELNSCYSTYGYGSESNTCTNASFDKYSTCIKSCPSSSSACDYVYSEQKRLSSQINDLCK